MLLKEKKRAGMMLLSALKSHSLSILPVPAIGMDGILNICRTGSLKLELYRTTDGKLFLAGCVPKKLQRKQKKKPKLK